MAKQLIDSALINQIRGLQAELMPDTCTIQYPPLLLPVNVLPDGSNVGTDLNEDAIGLSVQSACRISPARNQVTVMVQGGRAEATVPYSVDLPWNTLLDEHALILFDGQRLEILAVLTPKSFNTAVRCICRRLT